MIYLRQSTASQEISLGYFVDSTDGNTEETGLTINNTDIKLHKTGTTTLANKNSGGATSISNGIYHATLDATDTDTIGPMTIFVHVSGALAVRLACCVLDEAVFDVMFGTVAPATATNITAAAGITLADGAITAAKIAADAITAAKIQDGAIDAATFASGAINAAAIAADAITAAKIQDGAIDAATFAAGAITSTVLANDAITDAKVAADVTIAAVTGAVGSVTGNVGGNVSGSVGSVASGGITRASLAADTGLQSVRSNTAQAGAAGSITLDASASATDDIYNGQLVYITGSTGAGQARVITDYDGGTKVATVFPNWAVNPSGTSTFAIIAGQLPTVNGSGYVSVITNFDKSGYALSGAGAQAIWDLLVASQTGAGSLGKLLADNLDAEVSAVKAKTDSLTFTTALKVDARTFTNDDKTGYAVGAGGIAAASFAAGAIDAAALAASAGQEVADEVLNRDIVGGASGGGRNVRSALRRLRNRVAVSAGTATVYQEDDSTGAWTAAVTTTAGNPVTEVDPT